MENQELFEQLAKLQRSLQDIDSARRKTKDTAKSYTHRLQYPCPDTYLHQEPSCKTPAMCPTNAQAMRYSPHLGPTPRHAHHTQLG